ncbi:MAG: DarT ssDNA thymidine ADP-ribosyltransferase family protein [Campylobacterota bacterium]|nr:DarT ssDNA thymidine ADP-ribosyltransferase family protein [Campylobacterota bacterium]
MLSKEDEIRAFQKKLSNKFRGVQSWWCKALFHFTNIDNTILILKKDKLFSRNEAIRLKLMQNDNANSNVISKTSLEYRDYARLYFAPSTPTQYNNEGFKPKSEIIHNAHCPMPIMFLFNFQKVFMLNNVKFTDGNLATNPNVYTNIQDLNKLNFSLIYHRSSFLPEERNTIINARHSEVLVKNFLEVNNYLERIYVRSQAEKETLLYQIDENIRKKYESKITTNPTSNIFVEKWLYINKVFIEDSVLNIYWHHCETIEKCQEQYSLKIILIDSETQNKKQLVKTNWYPTESLMKIKLSHEAIFEISIYLDENIAYQNELMTSYWLPY